MCIPLRYNETNILRTEGGLFMASVEAVCARLCLLTRFALKEGMPPPLSRPTVRKMVRLGALEGLALRDVPDMKEEHYERAKQLLSRSADVYAQVQRYKAEGYEVILPEDDAWPANLYALGMQMPQFLFVKGDHILFSRRSVSVAGSREISSETMAIAKKCGEEIAKSRYVLVSGGAWGVDTMAQRGALSSGGSLILVPALRIKELLRQKYLCEALERGKLLIVCDTWPDEAFSPPKALTRNHTIYALGDAALVVASKNGTGGSWRGATDCIRGGYTPVFAVQGESEDMVGNRELIRCGASAFDPDRPLSKQLFGGEAHEDADKA